MIRPHSIRAAALMLGLGLAVAGPATAADAPSFQRDIVPLLKNRCAACHLTGEEPGGMALHPGGAYGSLVDMPSEEAALKRVKPGDPAGSYLLHKLKGTHVEAGGVGVRMPMDSPPLNGAEIARIQAWIAAGAPRN